MLDAETFLQVVASTPLVAVDLVVVRGDTELLLGQRNNRPAQGCWFVPGGRVRKNERLQEALARVAREELGLDMATLTQPPLALGAFEHFYDDCFAGDVGVSTHYVVLGMLLRLPAGTELAAADAQHSGVRWWSLEEAGQAAHLHPYTRDYVLALARGPGRSHDHPASIGGDIPTTQAGT